MTNVPENAGAHVREDRLPGEPTVFPLEWDAADWLDQGFRDNLADGGVSFFIEIAEADGPSRIHITPDRVEEVDDTVLLHGHNAAYTITITLPNDRRIEPTLARGVRQNLDGPNGVIPHSTRSYEARTVKVRATAEDGLPLL